MTWIRMKIIGIVSFRCMQYDFYSVLKVQAGKCKAGSRCSREQGEYPQACTFKLRLKEGVLLLNPESVMLREDMDLPKV